MRARETQFSQPFCGPEGRFDCSDSVCSLRPAPLSFIVQQQKFFSTHKILSHTHTETDRQTDRDEAMK